MRLVGYAIPPWVRMAAWGLLAAGLVAAGAVVEGWRLNAEIERIKGKHSEAIAAAEARERAREKQWQDAKQEIEHVATMARTRADADRRAADAAGVGLRDAFRAAGRVGACPAADPAGPPASSLADVRADVFSRIDQAAGELAAALDQSRTAGFACERSYDSLSEPPAPKDRPTRMDR